MVCAVCLMRASGRFARCLAAAGRTASGTTPAGPEAAWASSRPFLHVLDLFLLLVGEDFTKRLIDLLLKVFELLLLLWSHFQGVLDPGRHDLSGLRKSRKAAGPARAKTT